MIKRDEMQQLLRQHPAISLKMLAEFSSRLADTEQRAARIAMRCCLSEQESMKLFSFLAVSAMLNK